MSADVVVVGSCNLDLTVAVPALPAPGQTVLAGDVVARAGGKGANQAVAAHRLGARTVFVGAVGDDQFAAAVCAGLHATGLDTAALARVPGPSGVALIVVDAGGENTITVAPGANRRLGREHLAPIRAELDAGGVLLLQLETPVSTSCAAARAAHERGALVVLNAAPVDDAADPELADLLRHCDSLVVNEGEAAALGRGTVPDTDEEWEKLALGLCDLGPRTVVITRGAHGAALAADATTASFPAHSVDAVDTTGAGDAFCGAYAVALSRGQSATEAVELGALAGALATTALGAQSALPSAADLARFRRAVVVD